MTEPTSVIAMIGLYVWLIRTEPTLQISGLELTATMVGARDGVLRIGNSERRSKADKVVSTIDKPLQRNRIGY